MHDRVLIVEDDEAMAALLAELCAAERMQAQIVGNGDAAADALTAQDFDLVLTDLRVPGRDGLAVLELARQTQPAAAVVLITGYASAADAVRAFHLGASDVILKPFTAEQVRLVLKRLAATRARERRIAQLEAVVRVQQPQAPLAASAAMKQALQLAEQVAPTDLPVLLLGETGTGKGALAAHIHCASPRAGQTLLTVHCGALAPTLLESELFGHEKGAFTGAVARRIGLLELADRGTLFLDEINSASGEVQTRLLQFIQERRFLRVGGARPIEVDVRLLFAANQDLKQLCARGAFREDLYFRLNVFPIEIAPLRARREDIAPLARALLARHAPRLNPKVATIDEEALAALQRYHWPGNVRELENVVQRALVLARGEAITPATLPAELRARGEPPPPPWPEDATLAEVERRWIEMTLQRHGGNRTRAAKALGIDVSTLWRKLRADPGS
ncbi:MAG: sigma-54-dependent transcriptional regulator [Burkholderiaceae bacterium]